MTVLSGAGLELIFFGGDGVSGIEVFSSICAVVSLIDFCFILGVPYAMVKFRLILECHIFSDKNEKSHF
jgi:hypothetical protein